MFKKKECSNCRKKVGEKNNFCPNCGNNLGKKNQEEDLGMLGKNDFSKEFQDLKLPFGFNTLFNSLLKNFDSQFKEMNKELPNGFQNPQPKNQGISISISTAGNMPPKIKINQLGENQPQITERKEIKKIPMRKKISQERLKEISRLPKKEPTTEIKRFSDSVVYEINIPGVSSLDDISIIKLENSIEIKAIAKDKVYSKLIPINLPIKRYKLSDGRLLLELGIK